jgi:chromate reductase
MMGATGGRLGTARMQYHLRQACVFLDAHVLNKPEVMVAAAHEQLGPGGELQPFTQQLIVEQLEALVAWTNRLRG